VGYNAVADSTAYLHLYSYCCCYAPLRTSCQQQLDFLVLFMVYRSLWYY